MKVVYEKSEKEFDIRLEFRLKNAGLVNARNKLGLTIKEASERIGISYNTYFRCEAMKYYPSKNLQEKICGFYRGSGVFLMEEELFPDELKSVKAKKHVFEKSIPKTKLISLSGMNQMLLPPADAEDVYDNIYKEELRENISEILSTLRPKEQMIIKMRFGIDEEEKTLEDVAKKFLVKRERIWQIEIKAIRRLRHPSRSRRLKAFLDKD